LWSRWRCDLQDITLVFGSDKSRFYEYNKRAIFDRDCGPFVKMLMTRCVHCTRCVRFLTEVSGTSDFGMLGRGESSEIGTYIKHSLVDELSANIIDLCPVGALTSKPYSFKARPWELSSLESIDIMDCMASNIRIDFFNNKVYRILPIYDKNVNEDWITNKARFLYDSNNYQRIIYPMLNINNKFISITWKKGIYLYFLNLNKFISNGIVGFFGSFNDIELVKNMSVFFNLLGTEVHIPENLNNGINYDFRSNFLSDKIINIFDNMNNILFIGLNIRIELPLLNAKLRKLISSYGKRIKIFYIGLSNSYNNIHVITYGNSLFDFYNMIKGKNNINLKFFFRGILPSLFKKNDLKFINLTIFFKSNFFNNFVTKLSWYITRLFSNFLELKFKVIHNNISLLSIYEVNNYKSNKGFNNLNNRFIFLENMDDQQFLSVLQIKKENDFLIYHGQFLGLSANVANLIIPSLSFYEYNGLFINMEGRIRKLTKVVSNNVVTSFDFFTILKLCYNKYMLNNFSLINNFKKIISYFDFLLINWNINHEYYNKGVLGNNIKLELLKTNIVINFLKDILLNSDVFNFYKNDIYSINSKNMHLASLDYLVRLKMFI